MFRPPCLKGLALDRRTESLNKYNWRALHGKKKKYGPKTLQLRKEDKKRIVPKLGVNIETRAHMYEHKTIPLGLVRAQIILGLIDTMTDGPPIFEIIPTARAFTFCSDGHHPHQHTVQHARKHTN